MFRVQGCSLEFGLKTSCLSRAKVRCSFYNVSPGFIADGYGSKMKELSPVRWPSLNMETQTRFLPTEILSSTGIKSLVSSYSKILPQVPNCQTVRCGLLDT